MLPNSSMLLLLLGLSMSVQGTPSFLDFLKPATVGNRQENLPNPNTASHSNAVQDPYGGMTTTSTRIPLDPTVDSPYHPASSSDMLAHPNDSGNIFDAAITKLSSCYPTYISKTKDYMVGDISTNHPYSAPNTTEGMRDLYVKVFNKIPNTQSPATGPANSLESIMRYGQYNSLTYCKTQAISQGMSGASIPGVPGSTLLIGEVSITHWVEVEDLLYYIGLNAKMSQIIVSFRGSDNEKNYLRDIDNLHVDPDTTLFPGAPTYSKVHNGFLTATQLLFNPSTPDSNILTILKALIAANPTYSVYVTGHSLGAALATLTALAFRLNPATKAANLYLYTYGQPIVSNGIFADWMASQIGVDKYVRSVSSNDLVPYIGFTGYNTRLSAEDVYRHAATVNEIYAPLWTKPVLQTCIGYADNLCSENMACSDRAWDHHSWFGGLRIGGAMCLLSSASS